MIERICAKMHIILLCEICSKSCTKCYEPILRKIGKKWLHFKCSNLTRSQFTELASRSVPYYCYLCIYDCLPDDLVQIPKQHEIKQITYNPIAELVHTDSDDLPNPSVVSSCQCHDTASFNSLSAKLNWPGFSILHANVRSLKKNFEPLTILISELNHPPHFIAITETKINKDIGLNFAPNIPGYSFAHSDTQYAAAGVAIYTKGNISYVVRHGLSEILTEAENLWLEVKLNGKKAVISVIYRHPAPQ